MKFARLVIISHKGGRWAISIRAAACIRQMVVVITTPDDAAGTGTCAEESRGDIAVFNCCVTSECATVGRVGGPETSVSEAPNGVTKSESAGPDGRN